MGQRQKGLALRAGACVLALAFAWPAVAQEHHHDEEREPGGLYYDADMELQSDWRASSSDGNRRNNVKSEIEAGLIYQATPELSLNLGLKFEQVKDPAAGKDAVLEGHGLFVEKATVEYSSEAFTAFAGKFTPNFGLAWDIAPGLYTKEFAENDYELAERWGFGGAVGVPGGALGHLDISASAFFVDRTLLSNSLFSQRGRTTKDDGGPANTSGLSSFTVAIDGHEVPSLDTLEYQLAYVQQAKGRGDSSVERGLSSSLYFTAPLGEEWELTPFLEYAYFNGRDGEKGRDQHNLTAAARFDHGQWNFVGGYGRRYLSDNGTDSVDELYQLTGGYRFANGLALNMGYGRFDEEGVVADIIGFKLSYELAGRLR